VLAGASPNGSPVVAAVPFFWDRFLARRGRSSPMFEEFEAIHEQPALAAVGTARRPVTGVQRSSPEVRLRRKGIEAGFWDLSCPLLLKR